MMRMIRRIVWTRLSLAVAAAALLPRGAAAHDASAPPTVVAEALFLCDHLPPGGRDVNVVLGIRRGDPDPTTGRPTVVLDPRAQLALGLSDRVGVTADAAIAPGRPLDAPGASLKVLLRTPGAGRTGVAASVDLFGSTRALAETEAGLGLGALRGFGRVALRAGASVATRVGAWTPHLHAGASAAAALGARWRVLGEVVAEVARGAASLSAGPTVKVAIDEGTALAAGALLPVAGGAAAPAFAVQLTRSL